MHDATKQFKKKKKYVLKRYTSYVWHENKSRPQYTINNIICYKTRKYGALHVSAIGASIPEC